MNEVYLICIGAALSMSSTLFALFYRRRSRYWENIARHPHKFAWSFMPLRYRAEREMLLNVQINESRERWAAIRKDLEEMGIDVDWNWDS